MLGDRVTLIRETHGHSLARSNIWHVRGRDRELLVDSGSGLVADLERVLEIFTRAKRAARKASPKRAVRKVAWGK